MNIYYLNGFVVLWMDIITITEQCEKVIFLSLLTDLFLNKKHNLGYNVLDFDKTVKTL